MLIEIHMLKNYPPTNLNRDDTGAPKSCLFGGVNRGRISSQCLKRSWRTSDLFKQEIGEENLGIRTRRLPQLIADKLLDLGVSQEFVDAIVPTLSDFGKKENKGKKEKKENEKGKGITNQIMFFAPQDIEATAMAVKEKLDACKTAKEVKALKVTDLQNVGKDVGIRPVTLDIALFGRMVTSNAFRDVDASMQVAHAISTNKVTMESDYFTAMDDLLTGDLIEESGAAILHDTDYNASCYYIYASLDVDALKANLLHTEGVDEIVKKAVPALIRTMAFSNPSGKQNSFAGHVLPSAVLVECKESKVPTSMVNAFVEPVRPGGGLDLVGKSIEKLAGEVDAIARNYGLPVEKRLWFCVDKYDVKPACDTVCCETLPQLVEEVANTVK